ncbi:hypothetical protein HYPSUDRAFT_212132 [Hypholoma sublateritium FD-334 SS-4]|uniref:Hydrophobin n=1 Tax=Hypholoma sublateritium (strain FD-334 SS-4) TaxID=945553 RepID=A0A0D2Q922_HYPSF|nr:hypothetical protein HYPSUDRAFT_212132 [Hypholoma sublateritium FD-334 SS-4]
MQFTTLSTFTTLALAAFAVAAPTSSGSSNQCNSGPIQCCNSMQTASQSATTLGLLGLLGVVVQDITGQVGSNCSPISAIGVSGNSCTQQTVCCQNNSFNGVIALGCTPININL